MNKPTINDQLFQKSIKDSELPFSFCILKATGWVFKGLITAKRLNESQKSPLTGWTVCLPVIGHRCAFPKVQSEFWICFSSKKHSLK